jgi:hypothetical protein
MSKEGTTISVVWNPGKACGFHCQHCQVGREARDLGKTGNLTPEDVAKVTQALHEKGFKIRLQKMAGHSGDFAFMFSTLNLREIIQEMVNSLDEFEEASLIEGIERNRVFLFTNGLFLNEKIFDILKEFKDAVSLVFSIDKMHHDGSGQLGCQCEENFSINKLLGSDHADTCSYFQTLKENLKMAQEYLGVVNVLINCVDLNPNEVEAEKLRDFFGVFAENITLSEPLDPKKRTTRPTDRRGLNLDLIFVDKVVDPTNGSEEIVIYSSFADLLLGNPYAALTALVNE